MKAHAASPVKAAILYRCTCGGTTLVSVCFPEDDLPEERPMWSCSVRTAADLLEVGFLNAAETPAFMCGACESVHVRPEAPSRLVSLYLADPGLGRNETRLS